MMQAALVSRNPDCGVCVDLTSHICDKTLRRAFTDNYTATAQGRPNLRSAQAAAVFLTEISRYW